MTIERLISMTSIWMLSRDAMRGMDIIGVISDFLYDCQTEGNTTPDSRDRVIDVLERVILGARSCVIPNVRIDSFTMMTARAAYTEVSKTPSDFISTLEKCIKRIGGQNECGNDCLNVLRTIAKSVRRVTSRRVDTESLILH